MTHKKIHGSKSEFGELSLNGLQEDFQDNEKMALSYLDCKFGEEVVNEIKEAVRIQLITDGEEVFYLGGTFN